MSSSGKKEYSLGLIGFKPIERTTVTSICSLSHGRGRSYSVAGESASANADIFLVDAESEDAMLQWQEIKASKSSVPPVIMVSKVEQAASGEAKQYTLRRGGMAARLLRLLEEITRTEFNYKPKLVVGSGAIPDAEDVSMLGSSKPKPADGVTVGRALVVDDSLSVRTQMELCLQAEHLKVDTAENAMEAFELIKHHHYDIIFMDVVMPGMDGYQACKTIKSNKVLRKTPVILLTGRSSRFDKVRGAMSGCDLYLTKPAEAQEVNQVLKKFVPATQG